MWDNTIPPNMLMVYTTYCWWFGEWFFEFFLLPHTVVISTAEPDLDGQNQAIFLDDSSKRKVPVLRGEITTISRCSLGLIGDRQTDPRQFTQQIHHKPSGLVTNRSIIERAMCNLSLSMASLRHLGLSQLASNHINPHSSPKKKKNMYGTA